VTERLLQFIWQFQHFNKNELTTTTGESIQVIFPGQFNSNQGPDFSEAKIRIENTLWIGAAELHIYTSDWQKHFHQHDKNYKNVILHIVWENDDHTINTETTTNIPILELKTRVPKILLQRYEELMSSPAFIPCEKSIPRIKDITLKSWKERLVAERLLRRAGKVEEYLKQNNHHWEETLWWLLARNYGIKVNAEAFEAIARSVPGQMIARHKTQVGQVEALLLGQAGLLNHRFRDDYPRLLKREYRFLKTKYRLSPIHHPVHFLRMRPGNFPTVRLAQLAMLVHQSEHLFSRIKETDSISDIKRWLTVTASDYWHNHYRFDEISLPKPKKPGHDMIDNIIINTIVPVLFAYGKYHNEQKYRDRVIQWLEETPAEKNSITRGFAGAGIECRDAYDSQALIELKNQYCNNKRCLDCAVGNFLLKR
jgi:hypothetical protein